MCDVPKRADQAIKKGILQILHPALSDAWFDKLNFFVWHVKLMSNFSVSKFVRHVKLMRNFFRA